MGDTIEVIDGLDSDSTTGFNIFRWCNRVLGGAIENEKY